MYKMGTQIKANSKSWKEKAKARSVIIRRLRQEGKRQKQRAEKWRSRYYACKQSHQLSPVSRHSYPLEFIWLAIWMNISYNISLRGVSQSLVKLGELFGLSLKLISPGTIRNWCLKFGLHCLGQPMAKGKCAIICDESVEIGKEHLMLILGIPLEKSSPISPLRMEDVQVLDLAVQQSWKAQEVASMLQDKIDSHSLSPLYGIADKDHVLRKAYKECGITWIGDCTHAMANSTKAIFTKDKVFNQFIQQLNGLRAKWIMSKYNYYVPPALRAKTRFLQLFVVCKWAEAIQRKWEHIPQTAKEALAFVQEAKPLIHTMKAFTHLIEGFASIFKASGIHQNNLNQWTNLIELHRREYGWNAKTEQFIQTMNQYLENQRANFTQQMQILCCSDIIESCFGKYKNKGGAKIITDDVLKIAAYPHRKKLLDVKYAMEQVKIADVRQWKATHTTVSKLAIRKKNNSKIAA